MISINLDHASCSPLGPRVWQAMKPFLEGSAGNPSSLYYQGRVAKKAVERARAQVAEFLGAQDKEIIFTSSGTEANNLALKGLAFAQKSLGKHLVVAATEHHSILNPARALTTLGFEITVLPVDRFGHVRLQELEEALRPDTLLVSIAYANNEIGTVQPLAELIKLTHQKDVLFHTDAVAAVGQIPIDVGDLGVDLLSLAGNALYGPQGTGALFVRQGVRLAPLLHGGIQERGLRSGTENVAGLVGLGVAASLATAEMESQAKWLRQLRDRVIEGIYNRIPHVSLTGHPDQRLPGHASFTVSYVEGESMLVSLDLEGIAAASGSSCTARDLKISHVLTAIGVDHAEAQGSLVFTLGIDNTDDDIDRFLIELPPIVERLRQMSPLYLRARQQKGESVSPDSEPSAVETPGAE